ncbi:hypothetical protein AJ80_08652 [Polytolypa hystricis UAMH7299]|uniref:Uncharacterized protein n=1 Tax=Polytolypa hystricis (strain UAMH7299) TaxID=1447883 RepID=A0A2B7X4C3_POLH7|nr:hypothetical protein AJ80_08652 [Polytolypa hystricis UAMH7299]
MKLTHLPSPLLLLLIPAISGILANPAPDSSISTTGTLEPPRVGEDTHPAVYTSTTGTPQTGPRGVPEAPVDGKDGKPHAGPFIETSAERDRKKAMEDTEKDAPLPTDPKDPPSEHVGLDGKPIPASNDGVMDDKNRMTPKEGTRGTEGGVSEKSKDGTLGAEKKPDPPKEAPPLPHSEQEKLTGIEDEPKKDGEETAPTDKLLDKPEDLPEAPHSIPHPAPAGHDEDPLDIANELKKPSSNEHTGDVHPNDETVDIIQPFHSFVLSLAMIVVSEIGDKTFLVAALMAMRHPRMVVFSAAFAALFTMTLLSTLLGHAVPTLIPKQYTNILAGMLFLVFGLKMLLEARSMAPDEGVSQEMKEVEMELEEKELQQRRMGRRRSSITPYALESGRANSTRKARSSSHRLPSPDSMSESSRGNSPARGSAFSRMTTGINNLCSLLLSPAWVQTFVMTFLGEWGDRSQIATIAMAAGQDYWWVTWGAVMGHGLCTAAAVIGGRAIAGKVSMRVVTFGGSIAFFVFGLIYLFEGLY